MQDQPRNRNRERERERRDREEKKIERKPRNREKRKKSRDRKAIPRIVRAEIITFPPFSSLVLVLSRVSGILLPGNDVEIRYITSLPRFGPWCSDVVLFFNEFALFCVCMIHNTI